MSVRKLAADLRDIARRSYRDTDTTWEVKDDKIVIHWTGDRPKILDHLITDPEHWDVVVSYLKKTATININRSRWDF